MSSGSIVPAQYPRSSPTRIAFIGEAPGSDEEDKGIPLIGASGKIFNAMLRTANLERDEFYIGNVFDVKLPNNDISAWTAPTDEARKGGFDNLPPIGSAGYLRPEYHHHIARLMDELADVRPSVIVPLGSTALWAVSGFADISAQRGAIGTATFVPGQPKMVPTFHPAFVMRQWKFFPVVVADFIKAYTQSDFRKIILPQREILIEPTLQEFLDYVPRLLSSDLLSVDIETGWGLITTVGYAPDQNHAIVVPHVDLRKANKSYWSKAEEVEVWKTHKLIMENRDVPKLGQNFGGYDAYWFLINAGIKPYNFLHDTRLIHHNLYPELPKDLEFMGGSYTQQGAWKRWGQKSKEKRDS